jgi:ATP-binding cassette subfamily B protein
VKYLPRILKYVRPYLRLAIISGILILLSTGVGLLVPWPLKILVDNVLQNQPLPALFQVLLGPIYDNRYLLLIVTVLAGLALTAIQNGLNVLDNYVNTKLDQNIVLDFRSDLFEHSQRLSLAYHDQRRSGQLIYAINFQADAAARLVMTIPALAGSVLTLIGMSWITFRIDWQLALLSLTVVPLIYFYIGYYMKHIQKRLLEVTGMEGLTLAVIHEAVSMLRVIAAFGREAHECRRFRDLGRRAVDARVKLTVRQTLFSLAVNTTTAAGTALVLGFGAYLVMNGRLTVGQLLVVMAYIASVYKPLEAISTTMSSLQDIFISLQIAFDLLDTQPEIADAADAIALRQTNGQIAFENVHFNYDGRTDTLRDLSFTIRAGETVAIVGPTGAGKSTLVSLIPRFYDPKQGSIRLDGTDIRKLTVKSLRQQIGLVLQEPLLFSGSIADNIRYGRLDANMDDIVSAARAANAHDFILALPDKYETQVGERGVQLSGGERQRLSIARAFLKDAPILILDEPTSSIDSKTETVILDALDRLMAGRTSLLVAHRLSTVRSAGHILVLNHGRLVEQGSHDALVRQRGLYRQLWDVQSGRIPRSLAVSESPS